MCLATKHGLVCSNFMSYQYLELSHWKTLGERLMFKFLCVMWLLLLYWTGTSRLPLLSHAVLFIVPYFYALHAPLKVAGKIPLFSSFVYPHCLEHYLAHSRCSHIFTEWLWDILWGTTLSFSHAERIHSEKCIIRWFQHDMTITGCTDKNLV